MITTPPSERDLHAYVDHALSESERQQVELYLEAHPEVAASVHAILCSCFRAENGAVSRTALRVGQ